MEEAALKITVIGVLAGLINFSDPAMFGAAVTGALIYYVMFADRGRWTNIVLFLVSIPLALHSSPLVASYLNFENQSGVALACGALGLLGLEKMAIWIKNPGAAIRTLKEFKALWTRGSSSEPPRPGDDHGRS